MDWKVAVREAGRVLKPSGQFLFVECAEVNWGSFLREMLSLRRYSDGGGDDGEATVDSDESEISTGSTAAAENVDDSKEQQQCNIIFSEVGLDNVDLVMQPHVAGVAIKAMDADLMMNN
ncbi:LOW QUALITY PROTEIN: hypothetical protein ACHAWO_013530 [Cyclotella atomus]|uniref:Methyltransferase type 11 domain-containing protein n=1 Tax=Cyclotella atomus TaxID=382360 RepID=A0ABD3NGM8_9STRA